MVCALWLPISAARGLWSFQRDMQTGAPQEELVLYAQPMLMLQERNMLVSELQALVAESKRRHPEVKEVSRLALAALRSSSPRSWTGGGRVKVRFDLGQRSFRQASEQALVILNGGVPREQLSRTSGLQPTFSKRSVLDTGLRLRRLGRT